MNVQSIKKKIWSHEDIGIEELLYLLTREDSGELHEVYTLAAELNRAVNRNVVSFVLNRNINYTNICELKCTFCAYYCSDPEGQYTLTADAIVEKIEGLDISEVTIQGGLNPDVGLDDIVHILQRIKSRRPHIHIHGFSPMEIHYYAAKSNQSPQDVLRMLYAHGLDSLCGTAAEILDDRVRRDICPRKLSTHEWCTIIKCAHALGMPSTATILFGHIERPEHIAQHFTLIREIQKETGMFTEFIPLPFVPFRTVLGKHHHLDFVGLEAAKKIIACARIFFHGYIRNIQTSWVKLGLEGALACLRIGANDVGGTLYEENITRSAGGDHGQYVSKEQFVHEINKAGGVPQVRDTMYTFQKDKIEV